MDTVFAEDGSVYLLISETYGLAIQDGQANIVYNKDVTSDCEDIPIIVQFHSTITYKDGYFHLTSAEGKSEKINENQMKELCFSAISVTHGGEIEGKVTASLEIYE